ncbi:hypothetical protein ACFQZ4_23805 [Catellatospora coxensis]
MVLLVLATILLTMAELWQSAGAWTFMAELPPADRRGEYVGAFRMGGSAQSMIAPASLIALAVTSGGWGWFAIAGLFLGAALLIGPAARRAARSREQLAGVPPRCLPDGTRCPISWTSSPDGDLWAYSGPHHVLREPPASPPRRGLTDRHLVAE